MFPLAVDLTAGRTIRVLFSNSADVGKRVFFDAVDSNGQQIYNLDNGLQTNGFWITLRPPFVDSPQALNSIRGVQKDVTLGTVSIYDVDQTTGAMTLLATLAPNDQEPQYRRYFLKGLPSQCFQCTPTPGIIQVTAMAQRELVPVANETDYLLIQNLDALKAECQCIRFEEMDNPNALRMAAELHLTAIRLLNKELVKYTGEEKPAIQVKPFGDATLEKANLQMI